MCLPLFISNALCFRTNFNPHICVPCSPGISALENKNGVSAVNQASRSACAMSLCGRSPFFRVICHAECISRIHIPTRWGILTYQGIQLGANLEEGYKGLYFYSRSIFQGIHTFLGPIFISCHRQFQADQDSIQVCWALLSHGVNQERISHTTPDPCFQVQRVTLTPALSKMLAKTRGTTL